LVACIQVPKYIWAGWNAFPLYQRWLMSLTASERGLQLSGWDKWMENSLDWEVGNINTRYPVLIHTKSNWVINQASKQASKQKSVCWSSTLLELHAMWWRLWTSSYSVFAPWSVRSGWDLVDFVPRMYFALARWYFLRRVDFIFFRLGSRWWKSSYRSTKDTHRARSVLEWSRTWGRE